MMMAAVWLPPVDDIDGQEMIAEYRQRKIAEHEAYWRRVVVRPPGPPTPDEIAACDPFFLRERPDDINAVPIGSWWFRDGSGIRRKSWIFGYPNGRRGVCSED